MTIDILGYLGGVFGLLFLVALFRALVFGYRNRDRFAHLSAVEKSTWWFNLFRKNGFGEEAEPQRRRIALWLVVLAVLFFGTGAVIQLIFAPRG